MGEVLLWCKENSQSINEVDKVLTKCLAITSVRAAICFGKVLPLWSECSHYF